MVLICQRRTKTLLKTLLSESKMVVLITILDETNNSVFLIVVYKTSDGVRKVQIFRVAILSELHYENMPIQIYRKFHLQKLKNF